MFHPQNWFELVFWLFSIGLVLQTLVSHIMTSLLDFRGEARIVTSVALRPTDQVPFPMIVLSGGGAVDPLGFVRKTNNLVLEEDLPRSGEALELLGITETVTDDFPRFPCSKQPS